MNIPWPWPWQVEGRLRVSSSMLAAEVKGPSHDCLISPRLSPCLHPHYPQLLHPHHHHPLCTKHPSLTTSLRLAEARPLLTRGKRVGIGNAFFFDSCCWNKYPATVREGWLALNPLLHVQVAGRKAGKQAGRQACIGGFNTLQSQVHHPRWQGMTSRVTVPRWMPPRASYFILLVRVLELFGTVGSLKVLALKSHAWTSAWAHNNKKTTCFW